MTQLGFGDRLFHTIAEHSALCVGIDPHPALLASWSLPESAAGVERFGNEVVERIADVCAVVKPQVSFFEQYGSKGFAALERVLVSAQEAGLLVIADAKRGDIGSTNLGYASAWLTETAPFVCDALTVSPFLGPDSLHELAEIAIRHRRGLFVLSATSNPEAGLVQSARTREATTVAAEVVSFARSHIGADEQLSPVGVVIGATLQLADRGITADQLRQVVPILAPGFGAQGAKLSDARRLFPDLEPQLLASVSRSVLGAGRDGLRRSVSDAVRELGSKRA